MRKVHRFEKWENEKVGIMKSILKAKADQLEEVKDELLGTEDNIIAEAVVGDLFWSCGLTKEEASNTDPDHWPGQNVLGKLWMELRAEYREDEIKKKEAFTPVVRDKRKHSNGQNGTPASKVKPSNKTPPKIGKQGKAK